MKGNISIPIAIIIAGIIIAGAIFFGAKENSAPTPTERDKPTENAASKINGPKPVTEDDHILGNPTAKLVLIEFSDTECPFCKRFHGTMQQLMADFGKDGSLAWVYRHFPLDQLHPKARKESEATECAAELGGNDAFWNYIDRLFEITPSNNGLDLDQLPEIAEFVGLDKDKFKECLDSGKYANHIQEDYDDAIASGGKGTPYNVIITKSGEKHPISGALPYIQMKQTIEQLLAQ